MIQPTGFVRVVLVHFCQLFFFVFGRLGDLWSVSRRVRWLSFLFDPVRDVEIGNERPRRGRGVYQVTDVDLVN